MLAAGPSGSTPPAAGRTGLCSDFGGLSRCQHREGGSDRAGQPDANQLQTALHTAIAAEDYKAAAELRDRLSQLVGRDRLSADWHGLGLPGWLADRVEGLGYKYPTGILLIMVWWLSALCGSWHTAQRISDAAEIQKAALTALRRGRDAIIQSQTGSGKTLAFLLPLLARATAISS